MSNLQFEYQDSISINSLTLMCYKPDLKFDHYKKGIILCEALKVLLEPTTVPCQINNKASKKILLPDLSENSCFESYHPMNNDEEQLAQKLLEIRRNIIIAIKKKILVKNNIDSDDCCETRLEVGKAEDWRRKTYPSTKGEFKSKKLRADRVENMNHTIAAMDECIGSKSNVKTITDKLAELGVEIDEKTIGNIIKDAKKTLP